MICWYVLCAVLNAYNHNVFGCVNILQKLDYNVSDQLDLLIKVKGIIQSIIIRDRLPG